MPLPKNQHGEHAFQPGNGKNKNPPTINRNKFQQSIQKTLNQLEVEQVLSK